MLDSRTRRQLEIADVFQRQLVIPRGIEGRDEAHDFLDSHPAVHRLVFGQVADATPQLDRLALRIDAEYANRAVVAFEESEQKANRRCLAGRVSTKKCKRA